MKYISSEEARRIDNLLLTQYHYSIEQLIEAAGLCIFNKLAPHLSKNDRILVVCGPGNNGGDGLVLARYLHNNGYNALVSLPFGTKKDHLKQLVDQCKAFGVPIKDIKDALAEKFNVGVDAIYGFGYKPPLKEEVSIILQSLMTSCQSIVSIDVPTGWAVDDKDASNAILKPKILVSMTAPKICAQVLNSESIHLVVDEFIPRSLLE
jgi:hydroxyethylthiazole kinase-like uncharacterized protein yjeF